MKIVTVCGSLKFKEEMLNITESLALQGYCVIQPTYPTSDVKITNEQL